MVRMTTTMRKRMTSTTSTSTKKGDTMDTIRTYGPKTRAYRRLQAAADLINAEFDCNYGDAEVRDVFWDYGGGIKWTTICFGNDYQALDPDIHEMIVVGNMIDFAKAVIHVVERRREHINLTLNLRYGKREDGKH